MTEIEWNVEKIKSSIQDACQAANRLREDVQEIVVTKNRTVDEIQEMYSLGFRHFAENRVEKLLERQAEFPQEDIVWHLIGPLQSRKVKKIIDRIDYFHALDRVSIAEEINKRASKRIPCFIEVNISKEESKHGFEKGQVIKTCLQLLDYPMIKLEGLMTMAPFDASPRQIEGYFQELRELKEELELELGDLETPLSLSMGMSNDYPIAIRQGANYLRIGTAWFTNNKD